MRGTRSTYDTSPERLIVPVDPDEIAELISDDQLSTRAARAHFGERVRNTIEGYVAQLHGLELQIIGLQSAATRGRPPSVNPTEMLRFVPRKMLISHVGGMFEQQFNQLSDRSDRFRELVVQARAQGVEGLDELAAELGIETEETDDER